MAYQVPEPKILSVHEGFIDFIEGQSFILGYPFEFKIPEGAEPAALAWRMEVGIEADGSLACSLYVCYPSLTTAGAVEMMEITNLFKREQLREIYNQSQGPVFPRVSTGAPAASPYRGASLFTTPRRRFLDPLASSVVVTPMRNHAESVINSDHVIFPMDKDEGEFLAALQIIQDYFRDRRKEGEIFQTDYCQRLGDFVKLLKCFQGKSAIPSEVTSFVSYWHPTSRYQDKREVLMNAAKKLTPKQREDIVDLFLSVFVGMKPGVKGIRACDEDILLAFNKLGCIVKNSERSAFHQVHITPGQRRGITPTALNFG